MDQAWDNALASKLSEKLGADNGTALFNKYHHAFSTSYCEECTPDVAVVDIVHMEKLSRQNPIDIVFYVTPDKTLHLRLFQLDQPIPLSDILPMLENMDLRTFDERPYRVQSAQSSLWISDFTVTYARVDVLEIDKVKDIFQEAFIATRFGLAENDGFNKLILGAQLPWHEIVILRAYAKYLRQIGFIFSQHYIEQALANNAVLTKDLVNLFIARFDPAQKEKSLVANLETKILLALESVTSLDQDRIIRRILDLIKATLRTNYFQTQTQGEHKNYLSFKLNSELIPELPLPSPMFEIFVYSPQFEGIHLRNTKVARGGIRWSDRREDFRTEILGLMKAQTVKNAVIVPSGAKGGFVLKHISTHAAREVLQVEVINCYKAFIRGLLDLTDNLHNETIIPPKNVICYDESDTYLVVAADKGTASFSDIANSISKEYNFWLGDAFASGGSAGYDHKKMGITARGAWESVRRHFHELNINIEDTDFSVVGIGDMSGDVFGNGLIYSPHIKLLAAFDHRHIFLDPNPNPELSLVERERLFYLPTSSWEDYNPAFISKGGGVFKRSSKSIPLSKEVQQVLGIKADALVPNELIRAILKAPVDLLWNGGIGTYVKSSAEKQADVGDKTNEFCRINGNEMNCRIVGEGGNLGFTQLGRIEYASKGGLINTDFIDNSAGVDCSDHEVNIKILLNQEMQKGVLSEEKRNLLLASMTDEVADLVLRDNYNQALILSIANKYAAQLVGLHQSYIKDMEIAGIINRTVEFLPDDKKLMERKAAGLGLTRPELAILLAYTKIHIKAEIINSSIPDHPYLSQILNTAFPATLRKNYADAMLKHSLHREIVATQLSNHLINKVGITFVYNIQIETGGSIPEIVRACIIALRVFGVSELHRLIESLDFRIPLETQYESIIQIRRLVYLSTRWFLRHKKITDENMEGIIDAFAQGSKALQHLIPTLMGGITKNYLVTLLDEFQKAGIEPEIARQIASVRAMYISLNIIDIANKHYFELDITAKIYFAVGEYFNLLWFRDCISTDMREGHWQELARLTLRDELDYLQKAITISIMQHKTVKGEINPFIESWIEKNKRSMQRWEKILEMLHSSTNIDYIMFFIALKELHELIHSSKVETETA